MRRVPWSGERCIVLSLLSWTACTLAFFLVQIGLKLPEGFTYEATFAAFTSMFNDPHSLGSVSAALALGLLGARVGRSAWQRPAPSPWRRSCSSL